MPKSVQRLVAERKAIRAYVDQQIGKADLSVVPRLFAGLNSWVYKLPEDPALGGFIWSGIGLVDHRAPSAPVPPPANDPASGYDGGAFYHGASQTLILVNRGTETGRDWTHNFMLALLGRSDQVPLAIRFGVDAVKFARGRGATVQTVVVTGHSLGGGLAGAQFACLNAALAAEGQAPVPAVLGFCTASAPFGAHALGVLAATYHQAADPADTRFAALKNFIRPGDPIRLAATRAKPVLGAIVEDLPEVWTFWDDNRVTTERGHLRWRLESFRPQAHSAHRYFQYFGAEPRSCVVVNHDGDDLVLKGRRHPPGNRRFSNPDRRWAQLKVLAPL